jgi:hypothetical protein
MRMEAILAPIAGGTYSAWDFKIDTGTRFEFKTAACRFVIRGSNRPYKDQGMRLTRRLSWPYCPLMRIQTSSSAATKGPAFSLVAALQLRMHCRDGLCRRGSYHAT